MTCKEEGLKKGDGSVVKKGSIGISRVLLKTLLFEVLTLLSNYHWSLDVKE